MRLIAADTDFDCHVADLFLNILGNGSRFGQSSCPSGYVIRWNELWVEKTAHPGSEIVPVAQSHAAYVFCLGGRKIGGRQQCAHTWKRWHAFFFRNRGQIGKLPDPAIPGHFARSEER